jgi:hypothetical protein
MNRVGINSKGAVVMSSRFYRDHLLHIMEGALARKGRLQSTYYDINSPDGWA